MKRFWPLALKKIIAYKNENAGELCRVGYGMVDVIQIAVGFIVAVFKKM